MNYMAEVYPMWIQLLIRSFRMELKHSVFSTVYFGDKTCLHLILFKAMY